jgi:hypothetical protein
MRISMRGAIVGVIFAVVYFVVLIYLPQLVGSYLKGANVDVSGTLSSVFLSSSAIVLVILLAILAVPVRAIKDAPRVTGLLKVLQGTLLAVYFYVILGGGTVGISVLTRDLQLALTATVTVTLLLFEASALARIGQGLLQMREPAATASSPSTSGASVQ